MVTMLAVCTVVSVLSFLGFVCIAAYGAGKNVERAKTKLSAYEHAFVQHAEQTAAFGFSNALFNMLHGFGLFLNHVQGDKNKRHLSNIEAETKQGLKEAEERDAKIKGDSQRADGNIQTDLQSLVHRFEALCSDFSGASGSQHRQIQELLQRMDVLEKRK